MTTLAKAYSFHSVIKAYMEGLFRTIGEAFWENMLMIILAVVVTSGKFQVLTSPVVFWGVVALVPVIYGVQCGRVYGPYWGGITKTRAIAVLLGRGSTLISFGAGIVWLTHNIVSNPGWAKFINTSIYNTAYLIRYGIAWYGLILAFSIAIPFTVASFKFKAMVEQHLEEQRKMEQQQLQQQG